MEPFEIAVLDADTLGSDLSLAPIAELGTLRVWQATSPGETAEHIGSAAAVLVNKVRLGADILRACPSVRLICTFATGYDVVDTDYCKRNGIAVCNVRGYSTESVVDVTVAMALSLSTRLPSYRAYVADGRYSSGGCANYLGYVFHDLEGKTWGVCGYGNIGKRVAQVAKALGCRVLYTREHPDPDADCVDFETLCRESDILSLHVPLTGKTRCLMDQSHLDILKDGAILINVGRGALCDEEALTRAVESGKLGGLGVDVYSKEPFPADHPFGRIQDRSNVILTPHMAWASVQARERCVREVAENIKAFRKGTPRNLVF